MEDKVTMEDIKILSHRLSNVLGISETSMNLLKNADEKSVKRRWDMMRDVITVIGRDRIHTEIGFLQKRRETVERVSGEMYVDVCDKLLMAEKYYESLFDLLNKSKEYTKEVQDTVFAYGNKMSALLKCIIRELEEGRIGLQKI